MKDGKIASNMDKMMEEFMSQTCEEVQERDKMLDYSYWYPKIKDCGLKVAKSLIFPVSDEFIMHFYLESYTEDMQAIRDWVSSEIMPAIRENKMGLLFIKNGRFSNKFDARWCMCLAQTEDIVNAIANINYTSLMFEAGGLSEIVIEERIHTNANITPTIYNGLPYRPEFRVFYDFGSREAIYTVNYWDYGYVYPHLHTETDRIIFNVKRTEMDRTFEELKPHIESLVETAMEKVEGLTGKWSVDILVDEEKQIWLIDMAIAERSAYWELHEKYEEKKARELDSRKHPLIVEPDIGEAVIKESI